MGPAITVFSDCRIGGPNMSPRSRQQRIGSAYIIVRNCTISLQRPSAKPAAHTLLARWSTFVRNPNSVYSSGSLTVSSSTIGPAGGRRTCHQGIRRKGRVARHGIPPSPQPQLDHCGDPPRLHGSPSGTRRQHHQLTPQRPPVPESMFVDLQVNVRFNSTSHPSDAVPDHVKQPKHSHPRRENDCPLPETGLQRPPTPLPVSHGQTRLLQVYSTGLHPHE